MSALLIHHEDPLATCCLEEGAPRDQHRLRGLPQFEVQVVGLAGADRLRMGRLEGEGRAELTLAHLRIDLAHPQGIALTVPLEGGRQPLPHPVDVVLVDLRLDLEIAEIVDLADLLPGADALPQLHVEQSQFAVDRGAHL